MNAGALADSLAILGGWLDAGEVAPVRRVGPACAGWCPIEYADGASDSFAIGDVDPRLAEAMLLAIAAARGKLDVIRH